METTTKTKNRYRGTENGRCYLGENYIKAHNGLSSDPHFETGVARIQKGIAHEELMTPLESLACRVLLKDSNQIEEISEDNDSDQYSEVEYDFSKAVVANDKKKVREENGKSQYIDCSFIMGSAACVERLWSEADAIVSKRRNGLSPITLEMILFLKINKDLWDLSDVVEADKMRIAAKKGCRADTRIQEDNESELLMHEPV